MAEFTEENRQQIHRALRLMLLLADARSKADREHRLAALELVRRAKRLVDGDDA